jgi:chromosome segregation ATPase
MSDATAQIKRIQEKMQLLVRNYHQLQKDNERLKAELEGSRRHISEYTENIETLKQQVGVLKINAGEMTDSDKKEFEKKLNRYIREIDRCIAMLGD